MNVMLLGVTVLRAIMSRDSARGLRQANSHVVLREQTEHMDAPPVLVAKQKLLCRQFRWDSVQAFRPELAVEGLDERIVRRLARPREVERHTFHVSP